MKKIDTVEEFNEVVKNNESILFLKHSLTCPISQAGFEQYQQYTANNNEVDAYYLAVQDSRPLSNHIAETYDIKHESPQVLLFADNKVVWNASHHNITVSALKDAVSTIK
ncbi:bacillithiol system redox-active protein YtxJ [Niallia nealsonii]|uniref:Bacillithiol system redox-active protein YtxJ n=1 Tax=Niallia nealsonii TaxID=115979 RepID=A0A2N0Z627_9BACI|nr:bacillithiol system redox-active protein YtxJ [Niallia nealsonii]PKG24959.1 bacillithiol system redox-active protein YtxJ [Niallia nealsonii]